MTTGDGAGRMSGDEFDYRAAWHFLSGYLIGRPPWTDDDYLAAAFTAAVAHGAGLGRDE